MYRSFFNDTSSLLLSNKKTSKADINNKNNNIQQQQQQKNLSQSKADNIINNNNSQLKTDLFQNKNIDQKVEHFKTNQLATKATQKNNLNLLVKINSKKGTETLEEGTMINSPVHIHVLSLNSDMNSAVAAVMDSVTTSPPVNTCFLPYQSENMSGDFLEELQRQQNEKHEKESNSSCLSRSKTISTSSEKNSDRKKRLTMPLIYRMFESQCEDVRGTICGPDDEEFHPESASKELRQALSGGIQSNDKVVINVLLSHNNFQRQKIAAAYEGMYNRLLTEDIEEEAGGFFLEATLALIQPGHVYLARLIYNAISSRTNNRSVAVEIALTSSAPQLKVIRDAYQSEFRITLERDLSVKVEGLFGQMLHQILMRNRNFDTEVDIELIDKEIEQLLKNSDENNNLVDINIGRNFELFNRLFGNQGLNHIRTFIERYDVQLLCHNSLNNVENNVRGRDFESFVRKSIDIHSDVRQMLLLFIRISKNMQLYFAEKLHEALFSPRLDHASIIRILVTRSEIDLYDVCDEYKRKYGHNIVYDLQNTCSGDFLRLLYQLINPTDDSCSNEVFTTEEKS